jgi:hypothetical protein
LFGNQLISKNAAFFNPHSNTTFDSNSSFIRQNMLAVGLITDSAFSFTAERLAPVLAGAVAYGHAVNSGDAGQ